MYRADKESLHCLTVISTVHTKQSTSVRSLTHISIQNLSRLDISFNISISHR